MVIINDGNKHRFDENSNPKYGMKWIQKLRSSGYLERSRRGWIGMLAKDLRDLENCKRYWEDRQAPNCPAIFDVNKIEADGPTGFIDWKNTAKDPEDGRYLDPTGDQIPSYAYATLPQLVEVLHNSTVLHNYDRTPDIEWFERAADGCNALFEHENEVLFTVVPVEVHQHQMMRQCETHLRCEVGCHIKDDVYGKDIVLQKGKRGLWSAKATYVSANLDISVDDYELLCLLTIDRWNDGNRPQARMRYKGRFPKHPDFETWGMPKVAY